MKRELDLRYPEFAGLLDFLDHCAATYADALTGRIEAISVLYPGGSSELVEQVLRRTVEYRSERVYISLLCEAVVAIAKAPRTRPLRILEIRGGQGMLTWPLVAALAALGDRAIEYHFTDLGKVFVDDARREASRRGVDGLMTFGLLDVSRDPAAQGYPEQGFDVVVAFNVVHATRDVPVAIRHLEGLLAPGGTLGLVEVVKTHRWDALIWGLAEGWWYYDDAVREGLPAARPGRVGAGLRGGRARGGGGVSARRRGPLPDRSRAHPRAAQGLSGDGCARAGRKGSSRRRGVGAAPEARAAHRIHRPEGRARARDRDHLRDFFGVDRVGVHDDFFELGADSLIALRLSDWIKRELGLTVPEHAAFRGASVAKLARALAPPAEGGSGEALLELEESSPIVPIQPSGTKQPIYFVHPAAGVVFPYIGLARELGPDQPSFALQARGLDGQAAPDTRIEDMAAHYVDAIVRAQPKGPYHLGGFSFGCLVAFEMAQQLARGGHEVGLVALIDEPAPVEGHRPSPAVMARVLGTGIARSIRPHLHDYFYLASAERGPRPERRPWRLPSVKDVAELWPNKQSLEAFLARSTMANFVPRESRLLALRQPAMIPMFHLFTIHLQQTLDYIPKAYPSRVTVFKTDEIPEERRPLSDHGLEHARRGGSRYRGRAGRAPHGAAAASRAGARRAARGLPAPVRAMKKGGVE